MAMYGINRRDVLKGAAALLPLSMGFGIRPVLAGTAPKRVVFFFIPDGCVPSLFHPTGSEFAFNLSPMTAPLEAVRDDCVFVSGLTMYEGGATHEGGVAKVLTGNNSVSLDVFLGDQIGSSTLASSIYLGIHGTHENGNNYFSYLPGNKARTPEDNPVAAFQSLFGATGGAGAAMSGSGKSILDVARADLNSLRGRLGQTERSKLDLHVSALRELEQRLSSDVPQTASGSMCPTGDFNQEGFTVPEGFHGYPSIFNREENFELVGKLQTDLAVLALSCDVTRVVSIQWSHPVSPTRMEFTGSTQRHHDASHYGNPESDTAANFFNLQAYYTGRLSYLIK